MARPLLAVRIYLGDRDSDACTASYADTGLQGLFALSSASSSSHGDTGPAMRAGADTVFKIVPMEGTLLVNGEPQKSAAEILAEVAIALTLSQLHPDPGARVWVALLSPADDGPCDTLTCVRAPGWFM